MKKLIQKSKGIQAIPLFNAVKAYALRNGIAFFTLENQKRAIALYMDALLKSPANGR